MSKNLSKLINDLQGDSDVIASFLADPEKVAKEYDLSEEETSILLSKDVDSLHELGLSSEKAVGALSGAHSSQCWL